MSDVTWDVVLSKQLPPGFIPNVSISHKLSKCQIKELEQEGICSSKQHWHKTYLILLFKSCCGDCHLLGQDRPPTECTNIQTEQTDAD